MAADVPVVFYSWQSDLPSKTNRGLIKDALEKACKELNAELQESLRVDSDTEGATGSPDIASTILEKIEKATVFVADVSIIGRATVISANPPRERPVPNANVMYELGYAKRALGPTRVIMVCNTAYGEIETLPFDIRGKSVLGYEFGAEEGEKPASARGDLVSKLKPRVVAALERARVAAIPLVDPVLEKQRAREENARFEQFRSSLVSTVFGEGAMRLTKNTGTMLLHIVPATAMDGERRVDLRRVGELVPNELAPHATNSWSWFHDSDSIAGVGPRESDNSDSNFTRIFENGTIQIGVTVTRAGPGSTLNRVAGVATKMLRRTIPARTTLGIDGRCFVSLDLVRVQHATIEPDTNNVDYEEVGHPIAVASLVPRAYVTDDLKIEDTLKLLKPMLDTIWRSAGYSECWYLDENGIPTPRSLLAR